MVRPGAQRSAWEYGIHKLGFTVGSAKMITNAIAAGFTISQRGDQEANFRLPWTEMALDRVIKLLRLKRRQSSRTVYFPTTGRIARK